MNSWNKNVILYSLILIILCSTVVYGLDPMIVESDEEIYFTLLHTNDEHSSLIPHTSTTDYNSKVTNPSVGGYPRLATVIKRIRDENSKSNQETLLVSSGDFLGGTAFSWLVPRGLASELKIIQNLGYNAITLGNHEFDYGTEVLVKYLESAGYPEAHNTTPILATNIHVSSEHPLINQGLYKKYHIAKLENGISIGFFALMGEDAISVALNTKPVTFENQRETAQRAIQDLKSKGVDIIVALSHSGVDEDKKLAKEVQGIDIIIGGHSHTVLTVPIKVEDTNIVQAGSYLKYLGVLELAYNPNTATLRLRNEEVKTPYLIPIDSSIPSDLEMTALINEYTGELNQYINEFTGGEYTNVLEIIAKSKFPIITEGLKESPFGNFITDAMRLVTEDKLGKPVDVAIQANGSIRGSLIPGSMDYSKGSVSFYDLASLVGLGYGSDGNAGYSVVSFYLTGEEIYKALEVAALLSETMGDNYFLQFSGLRYDYNPNDAVLFNVPIKNIPIPSTRAVKRVDIYIDKGVQSRNEKGYIRLERDNKKLYHVITDSYILSFLPMAGEVLPQLDIVPKDDNGNPVPIEDFDKLIVYEDGRQLKVWKTVVEYAASQKPDEDGIPLIPDYYKLEAGRINSVKTIPLILWPILGTIVLAVIITVMINRSRRKSKYKTPFTINKI